MTGDAKWFTSTFEKIHVPQGKQVKTESVRREREERGENSVWLAVAPSSCRSGGVCQRCPDLSVSVNVLHSFDVQVG